MRTTAKSFAALAFLASASFAAAPPDRSPVYLPGYYRLYDWHSVWQYSDRLPWYVERTASWAAPQLVKWGYVPVEHDSQRYYCLIDHAARTGSNIVEWIFTCGDPDTVQLLYTSNRRPLGRLYGAP